MRAHGGLLRRRVGGRGGDKDDVRAEVLEQRGPISEHAHPRVDHLVGGFRGVSDDISHFGGKFRRPRVRRVEGRRAKRRGQKRVPANLRPGLIHRVEGHPRAIRVRGEPRLFRVREDVRSGLGRVHQQRRARFVVILGGGGARKRKHVRHRVRQHGVGLHLARVQIHDHRACPRVRVRVDAAVAAVPRRAEDQRVFGVVRVFARGSPRENRRVLVRRREPPLGIQSRAEEPPPQRATVAVVQGHERAVRREGDDLTPEPVDVARREEFIPASAAKRGECFNLLRRRRLEPRLRRENLRAVSLRERRTHAKIVRGGGGGALGRG